MGRFRGWIRAQLGREEPHASTGQPRPTPGDAHSDSYSAQPRPGRRSSSSTLPPHKGIASCQPPRSTSPGEANAATIPLVEATSTPHPQVASDHAAPPSSLLQRLWNQAYEQARNEDSRAVDAYEIILSAQYSQKDADLSDPSHSDSTDITAQKNEIERDADKRGKQMHQLVQDGLQKIRKDAKVKQGMEDCIQGVMAVKEVVDKAVQAVPQAALVWVGVCFALEILMNPATQANSNRQGIAYVVSRMNWYWSLSSLLLDENIQAHSQGLRGELEKNITQLYARLLLYQMKSVFYYHHSRFAVFMGDLVKHYNWDGELSDLKAAQVAVQQDSDQYNKQSIRARLGDIAETAKSQNAKLDSISSAIHEQTQQQKAMHETSEDRRCLRDLRATDPRDEKKRIEDLKGGLLKGSYRWVLENSDFQSWRDDPQSRLLWVRADPGKGKTMLLCGIIDELQKPNTPDLLAYFFCQATDSRINSATAVLRGLLYLLVEQQPSLISHVRKKYDRAGQALFNDANAWVALSGIFADILRDAELKNTYLIIDALDECTTDLPKLLAFIARNSSVSPRVKWIVSSRNWPTIEEGLQQAGHKVKPSLELNAEYWLRSRSSTGQSQ
ncbi:Vegetative incompatibility protein HET-E-1 [Lasiodiplodia theobromae]|uniref:Vegetative incompatibility protein HET-E-1 n=1 Tax=Lasiodiplodia theobromae TaxID=45133 RepID=A0A5N5CUI6_9PEZI|nr:Vegetative incompatibility protein HET-E-1 [Lasiodiplodia theobromae]